MSTKKSKTGETDSVACKNSFPQRRIQHLMNLDKYCGLTSPVLVEGAFIEMTPDGVPFRQVFLGLSSDELIFVVQEIVTNNGVKNKNDLELEGLVIDAIFPLSNILFTLSKNRSRSFSVITPGNSVLHFEMCKLDAGYRTLWNTWCKMLNDAIQKQQANNSSHFPNMPLHWSTSDTSRSVSSPSSSDGSLSIQSDMGLSSSDSDDLNTVSTQFGSAPCRRLCFMYGGNATVYSSVYFCRDSSPLPVKSPSWSDACSVYWESKHSFDKVSFQKILWKHDSLMRHADLSSLEYASSSDTSTEDDIDAVFKEAENCQQTNRNVRTGAQLWCRAKELVLNKSGGSCNRVRLEMAASHVLFQVVSVRKQPVARNIVDCRPLEVAIELTYITRRLLLTIRPSDLDVCRTFTTTKAATTPQRLSQFAENLRKFVMVEIVSCRELTSRVNIIVFFIDVCHHLFFTQRDFQSSICILRGMASLPVYRLQNTWATLFVQHPLKFSEFQALMSILSPVGHYRSYRTRVSVCKTRRSSYIPWFDHFFHHCKDKKHIYVNSTSTHPTPSTRYKGSMFHGLRPSSTEVVTQDNKAFHKVRSSMKVKPIVQSDQNIPNGSQVMKSILKKEKKKRKKIKQILSIFKTQKQKHVQFLLSNQELASENERKNDIIKHLAKTRVYPLDRKSDFNLTDEFLHLDTDKARHIERMKCVLDAFAEEKSKAILDEAFECLFRDDNQDNQTKDGHINDVPRDQMEPGIVDLAVAGTSKAHELCPLTADDEFTKDISTERKKNADDTSIKTKKGPMSWIKKKVKVRKGKKKRKSDIDHVNEIQSEIDSINNLIAGLEHFGHLGSDENVAKEDSVIKGDEAKVNTNKAGIHTRSDDRHCSGHDGNEKVRRKSYVPASVSQNRRQSLFEQAHDEQKDENIETQFTQSINTKLQILRGKRRSIALELLEENERPNLQDARYKNISNNSNVGKKTFDATVSNSDKKNVVHVDTPTLVKSASAEFLGVDHVMCDKCLFCGGEPCIYSYSVFHQLVLFQTQALNVHEQPSRRVRECVKRLMNSAKRLSDYELLSMSLSRE